MVSRERVLNSLGNAIQAKHADTRRHLRIAKDENASLAVREIHVRAAEREARLGGRLAALRGEVGDRRPSLLRSLPEHIAKAEKEASEAIRKANRPETRAAERRSLNQSAAEKLSLAKRLKALKTQLETEQ